MGNCCTCGPSEDYDPTSPVDLNHFRVCKAIGRGAFGRVCIVQKKSDKQLYALKYINKEKCIQEKAVKHIISERTLLEKIKHPFIVNLRYSFQDAEHMFMALDLMLGGDLRFHLNVRKALSEEAVKVIVAELSVALRFLHDKNIVHRDIKPDNVLLDKDGHAYLTDFNIAVQAKDNRLMKTTAGTEPYMAAEIFAGKGYGLAVDWWSLGVMLYELVYGTRPFRGGKERKKAIIACELSFPPTDAVPQAVSISENCIDVLKGLMCLDVTKRLGHGRTNWKRLQDHPWLNGIDWEKVERKEIAPVLVPSSKSENFDAIYEMEEILLDEKPLQAAKKELDPNTMPKEMVTIQNEFLYYDFERPRPVPRKSIFQDISESIKEKRNDNANKVTAFNSATILPEPETNQQDGVSPVLSSPVNPVVIVDVSPSPDLSVLPDKDIAQVNGVETKVGNGKVEDNSEIHQVGDSAPQEQKEDEREEPKENGQEQIAATEN